MPIIYVKLGNDVSHFKDERLGFELSDPDEIAGGLDYSNINEHIIASLNSGQIVQISESDFFGLNGVTGDPIDVSTNYLLSLQTFLNVCPDNNALTFIYQGGIWYKFLWSKAKECIAGRMNILIRVGTDVAPAPQPDDTTWQNNSFKDRDYKKLIVETNGMEIFEERMYTVGELADPDNVPIYYQLDNVAGIITLPSKFQADTFYRVREA